MSDFGNYYGSFESATEFEAEGNLLMAALDYWMCIQYAEHGEFPVVPDTSLELKAKMKLKKLMSKLPYASLSKTTFIKGCQCLKALWLYRNKYDQRSVSKVTLQKFQAGHVVGELARSLFPSGVDASQFAVVQNNLNFLRARTPLQIPNLPYRIKQNLWLRQTQEAITSKAKDIYEAAFTHDNVFAAVDILHQDQDAYIAYEVKSTHELKDVFIHDCALQYYVISHNIALKDFFLVYLNKDYVNSLGISVSELTLENCDINQLFVKESVLQNVLLLQDQVEKELRQIAPLLIQRNEPKIEMGTHCHAPYECDFLTYCSRNFN